MTTYDDVSDEMPAVYEMKPTMCALAYVHQAREAIDLYSPSGLIARGATYNVAEHIMGYLRQSDGSIEGFANDPDSDTVQYLIRQRNIRQDAWKEALNCSGNECAACGQDSTYHECISTRYGKVSSLCPACAVQYLDAVACVECGIVYEYRDTAILADELDTCTSGDEPSHMCMDCCAG